MLADVGKGFDAGEALLHLLAAEAEHRAVEVHVFPAGEIGIETRPQFKQRRQQPIDAHLAAGGGERTGNDLQQRALAASVAAENADRFARGDLEGNIVECPELPIELLAAGREELLQAVPGVSYISKHLETPEMVMAASEDISEPRRVFWNHANPNHAMNRPTPC